MFTRLVSCSDQPGLHISKEQVCSATSSNFIQHQRGGMTLALSWDKLYNRR